ncbi:VIT1/CCC1 family predicted Fe2+/Mn2+ transporter [Glaciihabitans tibetensis]|uniref:VIT1/CCC1 family predicted Fe2+/Mn2+ transporter n=1 Tax=Glaciihabitans tibetensis TaxID=1266600 RepID=A0A2T0VII7_9MICO|nr:VIT1/CCC1 family predicted Fe2+/Mn2+ transporter [Glaciihabitans tibetensis]
MYRDLAGRRDGEERDILLALAAAEGRHEAHWLALLGDDVGKPRRGDLRTRTLGFLARRFGSVFVLALAQRAESRSPYDKDVHATDAMAADERIHEEVVRGLAARGRNQLSGTFRAAVFGANDGLVSNLALVMGVSAAGLSNQAVFLTGISGLLAGALSMGAGEFVSVRSQRELLEASTPSASTESTLGDLDVDANELTLVYRARGMAPADAEAKASRAFAALSPGGSARPITAAIDLPNQHEEIGTGLGAAVSSFWFFASGAIIPIIPYVIGLEGTAAVVVASILVGLALLATGSVVGLLSGASPLKRALRQLAIGFGAAGATYLLGLAFGTTLG